MVSKDTNLRIKADALGLEAQDYETNKVDISELYTGITEVTVDPTKIDQLFKNDAIAIDGELSPNQAVMLIDQFNPSHTALAIAISSSKL